jgi:hypothetical protein
MALCKLLWKNGCTYVCYVYMYVPSFVKFYGLSQPVMIMSIWAFNGLILSSFTQIIVNDLWYNFTMDFRGTIRCLKWV